VGLDVPFCVKYCGESEELKSILKEFSQSR
jgi:hypothetical protein